MATPVENTTAGRAGAVCDPVTGVCRLPSRAGTSVDAAGLIPLPRTLRPLAVLEDENGNGVDPSLFKGKMVGVYVSAGWCPPCRVFSPLLSKWAMERKDEVAVVLVSLDKSEKELRDFAAGKGFVRIPFEPPSNRDNAATSFGVQALPTLVIVNGDTGAVVTTWGRSAVSKNPKGCLAEWKAGRPGVTWLQLLKPW